MQCNRCFDIQFEEDVVELGARVVAYDVALRSGQSLVADEACGSGRTGESRISGCSRFSLYVEKNENV